MSVKVTLVLNDEVVNKLDEIKDPAQRAAAVRDVLLSSADEIVQQVAREGLVHGTTITKRVGMTHDSTCTTEENTEVTPTK
jgi:adenylyl- and sulfurtransferase ThiI